MENFEREKIKIKTLVRNILSKPWDKSVRNIPHISMKETQRFSDIFWDVAQDFPSFSYSTFAQLSAIFPVALRALEGNFSEDRVKYVAELLMKMKFNSLKNGTSILDDSTENPKDDV